VGKKQGLTMRVTDWEDRFNDVFEKYQTLPFAYGTADCFTFPADVILAITGQDILAPYRGYSSKAEAAKLIVTLGGKHQGDAFAVHFPDVHPFFARRGDVGYMDYDGGVATGVFTHQGFTCKSEEGLISVSPERVRKAWKIEF